jgi:hypothetical protein
MPYTRPTLSDLPRTDGTSAVTKGRLMMTSSRQRLLAGLAALSLLAAGPAAAADAYESIGAAVADAAKLGKPLLIDFHTSW